MKKIVLMTLVGIGLAACSQEAKENLGLAKVAPDEFSVITRAPLSVPPDYTLRPPRPGTSRPMEISTRDDARQTIFGVEDVDKNTGVASEQNNQADGFLGKVGVSDSDPNIRDVVDSEDPTDTRTTAERLLFLSGDKKDKGTPIDPKEELERLKSEGVVIKKRNDEIEAP
jgi:hypothetical protein